MGFSRQEYWSGWPFPSPGDLPNSGIGRRSPALQADASLSEPPGKALLWETGAHSPWGLLVESRAPSREVQPEEQGSWLFAHRPQFIWAETHTKGPANSLRFPCKQAEYAPRAIENP